MYLFGFQRTFIIFLPAGRKNMQKTLTFDQTKTPGIKIFQNVLAAMQSKFHEIFVDCKINSILTVEENLLELFDYLARRLDAFVSELPYGK